MIDTTVSGIIRDRQIIEACNRQTRHSIEVMTWGLDRGDTSLDKLSERFLSFLDRRYA